MIIRKSKGDILKIRDACKILVELFDWLEDRVKIGRRLVDIDGEIRSFIEKRGGYPAFLGYRYNGKIYPASSCICLNDEIVHCVPNNRVIKEGDLVKIDVGVRYKGYYGDMARTFYMGGAGDKEEVILKLIDVTWGALNEGIKNLIAGNYVSDVSLAIERYVLSRGFYPAYDLGGHGVGVKLHEEPFIPNYWDGRWGRGVRLFEGMVVALEPMINVGTSKIKHLSPKWGIKTFDGSLSAHFEDTIWISENGPVILTREENL